MNPQMNHNQNPGRGRLVRDNPSHRCGRLCISLHGFGSIILIPGFRCDSNDVHRRVFKDAGMKSG